MYDSRNNCNAIIETASNKIIAGCLATKIPEGITTIGSWAFCGYENLTSITLPQSLKIIEGGAFAWLGLEEINIPENVTSIGSYAFNNCKQLETVKTYIKEPTEIPENAFKWGSSTATLYVPKGTVDKYKATKGWNVFSSIKENIESDINMDYLPFVDGGKSWYVARSIPGQDAIDEVEYYIPQGIEEVNGDGKAYYRMKAFINNTTETGTYLIREENRKIYLFDTDRQEEHLMFDYSLKAGDTYETYSPEYQKMVKYEVLSVSDYEEGPEIFSYVYDEETKNMTTRRRYLRKWVVQSDFEKVLCLDPKTWIEGVGSLEGPFASLYDTSYSLDHLAYVLFVGNASYLPFSFRESIGKLWFGCNLPTGEECYQSEGKHHQLTYELDGNRLHVYGKVLTHGGPNNYAYFIEEPTNDSSVRKLHFKIQEIGPLPDPLPDSDGLYLHTTDFYVPGFDPNLNYIIVDNQGEEHPVINKTPQNEYRPFIEGGKVWAVKVYPDGFGTVRNDTWMEYYYFDGDTIVGGQTCKRIGAALRGSKALLP